MSFFEDQYEAWMANGCQGAIEDYDGSEIDILEEKPEPEAQTKRKAAKPKKEK